MTESVSTFHPTLPTKPGAMIGDKYRVRRLLGEGGMGVVVEAERIHLGDRVAIKMLRPELVEHPGLMERFLREARTMVRLRGEHVARVHDVGVVEGGVPFIVMELLEGIELGRALLEGGAMPVSEAVEIIGQACEAVSEAHSHGLIHRDIKPTNLFVQTTTDGLHRLKVLDFGIAKATQSEDQEAGKLPLTGSFDVLGSPLYMSPEQITSPRLAGKPTDIWALGTVLYEMIAGHPPFSGETAGAVMIAIATSHQRPLHEVCSEVPAELSAIVDSCLAKNASDRPESVEKLLRLLAPFRAGKVTPLSDPAHRGEKRKLTPLEPASQDPERSEPHSYADTLVAQALQQKNPGASDGHHAQDNTQEPNALDSDNFTVAPKSPSRLRTWMIASTGVVAILVAAGVLVATQSGVSRRSAQSKAAKSAVSAVKHLSLEAKPIPLATDNPNDQAPIGGDRTVGPGSAARDKDKHPSQPATRPTSSGLSSKTQPPQGTYDPLKDTRN